MGAPANNMNINLYEETAYALSKHNLALKNIRCIITRTGVISVADFSRQAMHCNYDNTSGSVQVDPFLKIIGASWWMERFVYEGREGWLFCKKPIIPSVEASDWTVWNDNKAEPKMWAARIE